MVSQKGGGLLKKGGKLGEFAFANKNMSVNNGFACARLIHLGDHHHRTAVPIALLGTHWV